MRFVVDQQLPPLLADELRARGFDAAHVRDCGLNQASDRMIWRTAQAEKSIIVSRDIDFVRLHDSVGGARLVWVRLGNCGNVELLSRVSEAWPRVVRRLIGGDTLVELR